MSFPARLLSLILPLPCNPILYSNTRPLVLHRDNSPNSVGPRADLLNRLHWSLKRGPVKRANLLPIIPPISTTISPSSYSPKYATYSCQTSLRLLWSMVVVASFLLLDTVTLGVMNRSKCPTVLLPVAARFGHVHTGSHREKLSLSTERLVCFYVAIANGRTPCPGSAAKALDQ